MQVGLGVRVRPVRRHADAAGRKQHGNIARAALWLLSNSA
jgi:hypothetical protein